MNNHKFPISNVKCLVVSIFVICYLLFASSAYAVEASSSANLLDKINALKKEIASKAADLKNEVSKKLQNKAYSGFVTEITDTSVLLDSGKNILVNEYTEYSSKVKSQKSKLTLKDFAPEDYVVALGDVDDKLQLKTKLLIKTQPLASDSSKLVWGQIISVFAGEITVKTRDNQEKDIQTTGATKFILGNDEASILDAKKGKFLVAKGKMQGEVLYARFVYYVPSVGFIKPEKKAASSSATPSGSPKRI